MKIAAPSLKKRLLIFISIPVLVAGFLIALMSFFFSWHEIAEVYDAQMAHSARILTDLTEGDLGDSDYRQRHALDTHAEMQHRYERKTGYRVWYDDDLMLESFRAKDFGNFRAPEGFSDQTVNDKTWRFFVYKDPQKNITVEISQRYAIRYELINQLMLSLLIPALLFIPVILILIWWATNKSLQPLIQLSRAVDSRHSDDLSEIRVENTPAEVIPLTQAMNRLLHRIESSFRREREFTDNAAHELRTPLAAMKTQTQVLDKKLGHLAHGKEGFENLNATIDRTHHLIEQLLSLARLQNQTFKLTPVDLSECLQQEIHELAPLSRAKEQSWHLEIADNVMIMGHSDTLSMLLRNLIDNAIKYTPVHGRIDISLTPQGHLHIRDTGPGIPDPDKARVFERFVRTDKTGKTGSGLGLSIAAWIAGIHGVNIQLEDHPPQGLCVSIAWAVRR